MAAYYVDPLLGGEDNSGLSAASPRRAYRGLPLMAGDKVLFRRGTVQKDILSTVPGVYYGAYGEGEKPTFSCAEDVSGAENWTETETPNVWRCGADFSADVGNLVFNGSECTAALRWEKSDLREQGEFWDESYWDETMGTEREPRGGRGLYVFSHGNPGEVYTKIEAVPFAYRKLCDLKPGVTLEDIRFRCGLHGAQGSGDGITVRRCDFEAIGGHVWNVKLRIRFGNAIEIWDEGENITVEDCTFRNVYDSCVTYQGSKACLPTRNFICRRNVFDTYGMAAFEYRDRMPIASAFEDNVCENAGCGFAMRGEVLPRRSEIWPQPMGHHIFLWRIEHPTPGGGLTIRGNRFGSAPNGAAIYSIISPEAEEQITLADNTYRPEETLTWKFRREMN